ncbi:MAG: hypothetical protein DWP98_05625 [Bacteroidetes bacterium]|nr:MAG: hypothetical protein DWP98_05625 [Bacteroidota bacterium]MBL1143424.1 hypothetical protein [Bacteroidota bacterium]MCB0801453.1 hypothetical protein [Flavobacteriales bacterium]NOG56228.1 hypothetical protein [Bacteroidota bacterium]
MSEGLSKMLTIVLYALMGVSALLGVLFYTGTVDSEILIYWCYALFALGAIAAIVFPILQMAKNPKGAKSALIGVGALVIVFGISYALAGDEMSDKYAGFISGPEASKRVSTGLISFYILAVAAIVATVYSGVSKMFK